PELDVLLTATEELPKEVRVSVRQAVISMAAKIERASFASPIPPPEYMEAYERITPGSSNRILLMAEKQQDHRHKLEVIVIGGNGARERLGQIFAFILAV